jgi:hypothetical protein
MDPSCTWPGSQPDDLRRSGQASVLSCLRGTRKVRGRYIAGGDVSPCDSSNQVTPNSSSKTAPSPPGCPGPSNLPTNARASRARSAHPQVSRSPGPLPSHQRTAFPAARAPGKTPGPPGGHTGMHARLSGARQAGTRRRRWSVAVRAKSTAPHTAPTPPTSSAICPWTPQHSALQRDKVTRTGTEQKRTA